MYFNTHSHLNSEQLYPNRDLYIKNALGVGVENITIVGYDIETSKKAISIAHEYDFIYATVGIGPNDCLESNEEDLRIIEELAHDDKVVAIGEIGLDYYWDDVPPDQQKEMFYKQIEIAKRVDKPIVIHCRDAYKDMYDILEETKHYGIMHCYSGSLEMAKRYISLGYMISLAGTVTFKNAKTPKKVAEGVDLKYLLIETDDPYLTPTPFRGKQNEPGHCIYVAKEIAKLKGISEEEVAKATTDNARRIFKLCI